MIHLPQQIAASTLEVLVQPLDRVHVGEDHHTISFAFLGRFTKTDAVVITRGTLTPTAPDATTVDSTSAGG